MSGGACGADWFRDTLRAIARGLAAAAASEAAAASATKRFPERLFLKQVHHPFLYTLNF